MHYEKVADFISLATEVVPELLNISEKAQLVMNLRARVRNSTAWIDHAACNACFLNSPQATA